MSANQWGSRFQITTFGESHGKAMGVVIDGCPAGLKFDLDLLISNLERRKPGQSDIVSSRNEQEQPEILSGVFEGKTLGTPIAILVYNKDQRPEDYSQIKSSPRIGHADDVWKSKFGHVDHRGGGRASGRETLSRVLGGSVAQMLLQHYSSQTKVVGFATQIGPIALSCEEISSYIDTLSPNPELFSACIPNLTKSKEVHDLLKKAKIEGHSYGGQVQILIKNPPLNLGQPVFHKLKSDLAAAYLSVGATAGIEIGEGFNSTHSEGSSFHNSKSSSVYGGIRGGISTGENINIKIAFKPTSTVLDQAKTGRHDPCIIPRAIPVLEAMTYLVLADHLLWQQSDRIL